MHGYIYRNMQEHNGKTLLYVKLFFQISCSLLAIHINFISAIIFYTAKEILLVQKGEFDLHNK